MDFPGGRRSESLTSLTTSPLWSYIFLLFSILKFMVFPGGSHGKESSCNAGDLGSILGSGKSPGEGNGNPLQYSCLENPMDRQVWWATVHGVGQYWVTNTFTFYYVLSQKPCYLFNLPLPCLPLFTTPHKASKCSLSVVFYPPASEIPGVLA